MLEIDLVKNLNSYFEMKGIRYSNELRMGIGIPDISLNYGANYRTPPLDDYFLVSILTFVNDKKIVTFTEIQQRFLLALYKVKKYVLALAKLQLVEIKDKLVRIIKNIFSTNLGLTISIEAKLKDWKGACLQAQRYLCFSDYSYVALPSTTVKNVDLSIYQKSGIGLLSVKDKKIEEIIRAKKSGTCDFTLKYICTSKIIQENYNISKRHLRPNVFTTHILDYRASL